MDYSIGEFSKVTGIGIHALRYYEKERIILPNRRQNGRRYYTNADIIWIEFIKRLKDTGMPIKSIQKYAFLRTQGDDTLEARMEMLIEHRILLSEAIATMQKHFSKLNDKIIYYRNEINKKQK